MKLKKRIFSFLAVLAVSGLALLTCPACMSAEEKEKAKEDIRCVYETAVRITACSAS